MRTKSIRTFAVVAVMASGVAAVWRWTVTQAEARGMRKGRVSARLLQLVKSDRERERRSA